MFLMAISQTMALRYGRPRLSAEERGDHSAGECGDEAAAGTGRRH
jgi:hypothetical protein